jgi:glycosyltransferase involved in cell wall biosynthesis
VFRKLKIAFVIDAYSPGGGTETQLHGLLRCLDRSRVDACLFTLRGEIPAAQRDSFGWPVACLDVRRLGGLTGLRRFIALVRRLRRERYDVVSIYFIDSNLFVVPACWLAGVPVVVVNRRDMGYWYDPRLLRRLSLVNRMADHFLVNSQAVKAQVVARERFPADRIKVIYNGLWDGPGDIPAPGRVDLPVPQDTPVVGIVANLRPVKRIDRFLAMAARVAAAVPQAHFVLLGAGGLEQDLRQQVTDLDIAERVHFLGLVPDVPAHLARFDVGVLTSESEGLSNALIEYAQAGLPAVAFDTGGNCEVIADGQTGFLVPEGDVDTMAERVLRLLGDTELRRRQGETARRQVLQMCDPGRVMDEMMAFFAAIAAKKNR